MLRHLVQNKIRKITDQSRLFANDARGTVAIIFGISILPLMLAMGLAVDFSTTVDTRSKLDAAADAAALAGATGAKNYLAKHQNSGFSLSALNANAIAEGQREAKTYFDSNLSKVVLAQNIQKTVNVNIAIQNREVTSTVTYDADAQLAFGPLIQINQFHVSNTVVAASALPTYIDFYLLLDNSPSMGLAASPAEIAKMRIATKDAGAETCEFACHSVKADGSPGPNNTYPIARANNIELRIDLLSQATAALTHTAKTTEGQWGLNNLYRMGIYQFNRNVTVLSSGQPNSLTPDNGITSDLTTAGTIASTLALAPYRNDGNYFLTSFTNAFAAVDKIVTAPGDGSAATLPQKYVFFVTDGVQDLPQGDPTMTNTLYTQYDHWGHTTAPIDPQVCSSLKSRGIKVAVLYTTYYATAPGDSELYDNRIQNWTNDIPTALSNCASPGLFYTADSSGIAAAMNKMFNDAVRQARLTH